MSIEFNDATFCDVCKLLKSLPDKSMHLTSYKDAAAFYALQCWIQTAKSKDCSTCGKCSVVL